MSITTGPWPRSAASFAALPSVTESSTVLSNAFIPRSTSPPTCGSDQLVIQLTTTLLIPSYSRFYSNTPINDFKPSYFTLADGSLVTRPFIDDLFNSNVSVLVLGILTMLFARNIFVSGDYLRRANIKRKSLFKVLFASQLLAITAFIPMIISQFNQYLNCTVVNIVSRVATSISLDLLITWILGYKAYRCLNNSRLVLFSLLLLLSGSTAVFILEMIGMRAERRLSGGCIRTSDLSFTRIYILLQLVQSFFISCCFVYAVYKTRGSTVYRGRISVRLSLDNTEERRGVKTPDRRGWWDYVPKNESEQRSSPPAHGFFGSLFRLRPDDQLRPLRKPSITGESFPPQQVSAVQNSGPRSPSPTPSSHSRLSRYIPRMELFRDVMRDELCYTTFITISCVVVAILALIAVNFKNSLTVSGWITLNWAVISLLAIHSFGRVIRRHERDAILQEPSSWQPKSRAPRTLHIPSQRHRWRNASEPYSPFSETRGLTDSRGSWSSYSSHQSEPSPLEEKPEVPLPSLVPEEYPRALFLDVHDYVSSSNSPGFSTLVEEKSLGDNVP